MFTLTEIICCFPHLSFLPVPDYYFVPKIQIYQKQFDYYRKGEVFSGKGKGSNFLCFHLFIRKCFIHFLLFLCRVAHSIISLVLTALLCPSASGMRLTARSLFGALGNAESQLSLPMRVAISETEALPWLQWLPLKAGVLLGSWVKAWAVALSEGWPGAPPSPPPQPLTTLDGNSIEFKSLVSWSSQAAGPEALSNQGFYSYFNPREMPVFLCLTKTSKTVHTQRLVRYKVLRRKLSQILLWGGREREQIHVLFFVLISCLFLILRDGFRRNDTINK